MTSPETGIEAGIEADEAQDKPKLNLEVQVDKSSACTRHITVTIPRDDMERYYEEAYSELMPSASVPGFRAGRAPRKLVEQRFREQVSDQVKGSLLMDSMTQVSEDHDFSAISEPDFDFDAIEIPESGPMKFEFDLEVRPEFDMPQWKGLKLDRLKREITKADVDRQLAEILSEEAEFSTSDAGAEAGDVVELKIKSTSDGKVIAESQEEQVALKPIASFPDARIEGFDKLLAGAKAGDVKSTKATISHDVANTELQGEEVDVEFAVVAVKKLSLPELNAETLNRLGGFETEGDLRDRIQEEMDRQTQYQQQQRVRKQITSLLTKSADWDLPPDLVRRQSSREMDRAILEMKSAGFNNSQIKAYEHELRQNSLATTKTALQEHFILERIAEDEGLEAEPADYDSEIALVALQSRESVRRTRAQLEKRGMMDALRNQIVERKVLALIEENAKFNDVKFEPEKNETVPIDFLLSGIAESAIPEAKHGGDSQALQQPVDHT